MNNDTLSICINATIQQPPHAAPYLGSGATIDGNYCGVRSFAILSKIWTIERDKQICNLYIYIYIYMEKKKEVVLLHGPKSASIIIIRGGLW